MSIELRIPRLTEMSHRQAWLADPATMAYNRGREAMEGYDPATGCIDFSRENWRWWRQVWLYNEPDFYAAYAFVDQTGAPVGEVCWFREGEDFTAGILIAAEYRGRGLCAPALRTLADHAFRREEIPALRCRFSACNLPAIKGFLRAGFHIHEEASDSVEMLMTREEWERL